MSERVLRLLGLVCLAHLVVLTVSAGCAAMRPPTAVERQLFTIHTNVVERVVTVTNVVTLVAGTEANGAVLATNVARATNRVEETTWTPSPTAERVQQVGQAVGDYFGPFGKLIGVLIGGIIAGWGTLRASRANKVAATMAQIIETGRKALQETPQGRALDEQWVIWMKAHQRQIGIYTDVARILENVVNEESAQRAAAELIRQMELELERARQNG